MSDRSDKFRNEQLRLHIVQVMTGLGRPSTAQTITERCQSRCPELMGEGAGLFVVATNLGYLRSDGIVKRRMFRTGRNITVHQGRCVQETVGLWFPAGMSKEELELFQKTFIEELTAKRKEAANARKVHKSE